MFNYDARARVNAMKELDRHDLTDYLARCWRMCYKDPWAIRQYIQNESVPKHMELFEALGELSLDELMAYLSDRYGIKFKEIVSYQMERPTFIKD